MRSSNASWPAPAPGRDRPVLMSTNSWRRHLVRWQPHAGGPPSAVSPRTPDVDRSCRDAGGIACPLSGLARADVRGLEGAVDTRREILALVGVVGRDGLGLDRSTVLNRGMRSDPRSWPRRSPPQGEMTAGPSRGVEQRTRRTMVPARAGLKARGWSRRSSSRARS